MTYLELCQRLRREASVSGEGVGSVLNQLGEPQRLVDWIATAYEDIQRLKEDWRFLTKDFSFTTNNDQNTYDGIGIGLADFANWRETSLRIHRTTDGVSDQQLLTYLDYNTEFRNSRGFGAAQTLVQRPYECTVKPDNSLLLFPIPDASGYTVTGEYYQTPHKLVNNTDIPIFPERFHMVIVWKALIYYGLYESAQEMVEQGQRNYNALYAKLEQDRGVKFGAHARFV